MSDIARDSDFYKFQKGVLPVVRYWTKRILFRTDRTKAIGLLESLFQSCPFYSSSYAGAIVGQYAEKEYMKMSSFLSYVDLEFEGYVYSCIADYDSYLTEYYGDYMQLSPLDKQVSNHDFEVY